MFVVLITLNITSKTLFHCYRYFASVCWCKGILWVTDLMSSITHPDFALTPLQNNKAGSTWPVGYTLWGTTIWSKTVEFSWCGHKSIESLGVFFPLILCLISQATKSFICWNTKNCDFNIFPHHHTHILEVHLAFGRQVHILHIT